MLFHWAEKQLNVEGVKKQTLNTADTVWKEGPSSSRPLALAPGVACRQTDTEGVSGES